MGVDGRHAMAMPRKSAGMVIAALRGAQDI
jgi:hypothetical protein